jgi:hypothetical protein
MDVLQMHIEAVLCWECLLTILMGAVKEMYDFRRRVAGSRIAITFTTSLEFHRTSWGIDTMVHPAR